MSEIACLLVTKPALVEARHIRINLEHRGKLLRTKTQRVEHLALDHRGIHTVFAVQELDDITDTITYSTVILNDDVLHGLDETTLDVTSFRCLNRSVNQTFATTHGVEEELLRSQAA